MPKPAPEKNKGGLRLPVRAGFLPAWIVMIVGAWVIAVYRGMAQS